MITIDLANARAGRQHFDPASEDFGPRGGRIFGGLAIPEHTFPNGLSSASGTCIVVTPFGVAIVHYESFCGSAVFGAFQRGNSGWPEHDAFTAQMETGVPILLERSWDAERGANHRRYDDCVARLGRVAGEEAYNETWVRHGGAHELVFWAECPCWRCETKRRPATRSRTAASFCVASITPKGSDAPARADVVRVVRGRGRSRRRQRRGPSSEGIAGGQHFPFGGV